MTQKADPNGLKQCPKCGEWKVRREGFYYRKDRGAWQSWCKECLQASLHEITYRIRAEQPKSKHKLAPEGQKYCSRCDSYLPVSEFYEYKGKPIGHCLTCRKIEHAAKYEHKGRKGMYHGKPAMTEEEKAAKRRHYSYRKNLQERGYEPIHTLEEWQDLLDRTGHKCIKCGAPEEYTPMTRDHIMPLSEGGTDEIWNIQPLCLRCNGKKHTKLTDYRGNSWVSA